jgi:hypothetical protein
MVKVEMLEDLDYGSWYYPKGDFVWITKEDAEACEKIGAIRIVSQ